MDSLEAFHTDEAPVALKGPSADSVKQGQGLSGQALQPLAPMFPLSPQSAQRPHHSRLAVDEATKQLYFVLVKKVGDERHPCVDGRVNRAHTGYSPGTLPWDPDFPLRTQTLGVTHCWQSVEPNCTL